MAMLHSSEWWWNDSERSANVMPNSSLGPVVEDGVRNYYAMFYSLLILAIVFGNVLVCLAVVREKSLQTTTNYLVVSLAVADLLVASLVMPWVVYLEVVGGSWLFSRLYCNIFVTLDVMMCTASILNLCAISIDRYTAVVMPVLYNTTDSSRKRVSVMIAAVWILAFAVSCPLLFGFNTTYDPLVCSISNPDFVIYSSIVSFYLPFMVTLLVYVRIYIFLRRRRKRIMFRQASSEAPPRPTLPTASALKPSFLFRLLFLLLSHIFPLLLFLTLSLRRHVCKRTLRKTDATCLPSGSTWRAPRRWVVPSCSQAAYGENDPRPSPLIILSFPRRTHQTTAASARPLSLVLNLSPNVTKRWGKKKKSRRL
ncbi:D(3) dopamine receptor isoform X6 [Silurus meridionalis]|uniref:D(3) dopamine receptor isoform X6 n=1 Tax=Silurus meridionalis TaxID=175797 RepID=UPI001EEC2B69|nr:D(3) dopamine receptor isoform X6 [Silurus meridionalis]